MQQRHRHSKGTIAAKELAAAAVAEAVAAMTAMATEAMMTAARATGNSGRRERQTTVTAMH